MINEIKMWIIVNQLPREITIDELEQINECIMAYPTKECCTRACVNLQLNELNLSDTDIVYIVADDGKPMQIHISDLLYNSIILENNTHPVYFSTLNQALQYKRVEL